MTEKIIIRPALMPYGLAMAVLMTAGSALLKDNLLLPAAACWSLVALIGAAAAFDRIEFDGRSVRRRGLSAFLLTYLLAVRQQVSVFDIETITTETSSFSFSGGDTRLSYRTRIMGAGAEISVRSQRTAYAQFIKQLFRAAGPHKLDPRSFELFQYFESGSTLEFSPVQRNEIATLSVPLLRRVGNALRLAGRLAQASSYFRIAYEKEPRNPELLYEMARFFHSSAQSEDLRLLQRSNACLRLASKLAASEPDLLERIGEVFFERLDYKRAADCFQRALQLEPGRFRANVGLAEIALRDGKLAHVAHFYNAAATSSDTALARLARREASYYERLVGDDSFLEAELRRIRTSNLLRWARHLSALTFFGCWIVAGLVGRFYPIIEDFGWALMATSGMLWSTATLSLRYFRRRAA